VARLRRELEWRRARRERGDDSGGEWAGTGFDFALGGLFDDGPTGLLIGIALVAGLVLLWFVGIPVLLGLVDLVVLLVVVVAGVAAHVLLGRPWTVEAVRPDGDVATSEQVVGWWRSGETRHRLAREVERGTRH
jgi:hypothetical protein